MSEPTGRPPSQEARPTQGATWAGAALLVAGIVVMVTETPNLLFFLGLLFFVAGVWALANRSRAPATGPAFGERSSSP